MSLFLDKVVRQNYTMQVSGKSIVIEFFLIFLGYYCQKEGKQAESLIKKF